MYNSDDKNEFTKEVDTSATSKKSVVAGEEVILDDSEKVEGSNSKKINTKILIGAICLILVVICVIAAVFIFKDKSSGDTDNKDDVDENYLLVKVSDTYEGLNYEEQKENVHQIGFFYDYSKNKEGYKIDVSYSKVSGLKDENTQNKINELLYNAEMSLYDDSCIQDKNVLYEHISNYTDVYIFNNVLSTLYCKEVCDIEGNSKYEYKAVNVNIKDFTEIEFSDIFTKNTNLDDVLSEKAKAMYNSQNFVFSISPKNIYIPLEDEKVETINLYSNMDKVAIYKRYADNTKIFNKTYKAMPYVFETKKFTETDSYGLVEDNLFIDTCNNVVTSKYNDNLKNASYELYKEAVNKAKNLSYSNPSKRYLVQLVTDIIEEEENYKLQVKYKAYEIDKKYFKDNIISFVVASENKKTKEYAEAEYFKNTVLDAENYLLNTQTETLEKKVDENGEVIKPKLNIEENSTGGNS